MPTRPSPPSAIRPPLKWAGGKRWQVPLLLPFWERHRHRRLVEPVCGGLAVALGLQPERALLNDANPHLINFYTWVQRGLTIDSALTHSEAAYYRNRDRSNRLTADGHTTSRDAAVLFYYLNRTGYNGLCRFNRSGGFNVPFGRYASISYTRDFSPWQAAMRGWTFQTGDFEALALDPDDFIYADPPYDVEFTHCALITLGDAVLEVTGETDPCERMEAVRPGLIAALASQWRAGVTCRVSDGGLLTISMDVSIEPLPE